MSTTPKDTVRSPQPSNAPSAVVAEAMRRAQARLAAEAKPAEGVSHTDFPGHHTCA